MVKNKTSVKNTKKKAPKTASKTASKNVSKTASHDKKKSSAKEKKSIIKNVAMGHMVSVDYVGTLSNGEEFDNSKNHGPISFIVGNGQVIKGFDSAVIGMKYNDKKKFTIKKEDAYGDINPALVHKVPLDKLPPKIKGQLKIGGFLVLQSPAGQQIPAKITGLDDKEASLDMNHPLAGKDLTFEITIRDIKEAPASGKGDSCCGGDCECDHENKNKDGSDCCGSDCGK